MESLNSNMSSVTSSELEAQSNDRPLSPVLSTSKMNRRMLFGRRLGKQKSRVKLADRFSPGARAEPIYNKFSTCTSTQVCRQGSSAEERLKKIKNLEDERRQFYACMCDTDGKSQMAKNLPVKEFEFKKPISPMSSYKCVTNSSPVRNISCNRSATSGETCNKDQLNVEDSDSASIQTASGKSFKTSEATPSEHSQVFEELCNSNESWLLNDDCVITFPLKAQNLSRIPRPLRSDKDVDGERRSGGLLKPTDFLSASGKNIDVSESNLSSLGNVFADENLDDLLSLSPSKNRISVRTCSGSHLLLTDSLMSMAEKMFAAREAVSSTTTSDVEESKQPRKTMDKIFSNENYHQFSSGSSSLANMNVQNSTRASISRTSSACSNFSNSTVDSSNVRMVDEKSDVLTQNPCFGGVSDTDILLAADNALSAMEFGSDDWNSTCKLSKDVSPKEPDKNLNDVAGVQLKLANEKELTGVSNPDVDLDKRVAFVSSQPQVDCCDDFPLSTQETNMYFANFTLTNLPDPTSETSEQLSLNSNNNKVSSNVTRCNKMPESNECCVIKVEPRTKKDCSRKEVANVSSKSVINLSIFPSMIDCKTLYSKNLVELHRNKHFLGNSEESVHGSSNIDYEISQHSVQVRQKTIKSRRRTVAADFEGFCECEQRAAEEKLIKMVRHVKKAEADLEESQNTLTVKQQKKDRTVKEKKTKREMVQTFGTVMAEVIQEEGEENVVEQEEHPNNVKPARTVRDRKSKRKKEKTKSNKCKRNKSGENVAEAELPVSKRVRRDCVEANSDKNEEGKLKGKEASRQKASKNDVVESKDVVDKAVEEFKDTVIFDHVSLVSEKSCKKYKVHKKRRKSADTKEVTKEIADCSVDNQNMIELSPNQGKFKIEIDCNNKVRINISCNSPTAGEKLNLCGLQVTAGKETAVIGNGENKLEYKAIQNHEDVKQFQSGSTCDKSTSVTGNDPDREAKVVPEARIQGKADVKATSNKLDEEFSKTGDSPVRQCAGTVSDYRSLDVGGGKEKIFKKFLNKAHKIYKEITQAENQRLHETKDARNAPCSVVVEEDASPTPLDLVNASFETDNFTGEHTLKNCGFKSASGKEIKISADALKKAERQFDKAQDDAEPNRTVGGGEDGRKSPANSTRRSKKLHKVPIETVVGKSEVRTPETRAPHRDVTDNIVHVQPKACGFSYASGKLIELSEEAIKKAEEAYKELGNFEARGIEETLAKDAHKPSRFDDKPNVIETAKGVDFSGGDFRKTGFMSASGKKLMINEDALSKAQKLYRETENVDFSMGDFETSKSSAAKPDVTKMERYEVQTSQEETVEDNSMIDDSKKAFELLEDVVVTVDNALEKITNKSGCKKRLGISRCKQIAVSKEKLEEAKSLFEDLQETTHVSLDIAGTKTPGKPPEIVYNSTPVRSEESQQIRDRNTARKFHANLELSPIRATTDFVTAGTSDNGERSSSFVLHQKTEGNIHQWHEDVSKQIVEMRKKLEVLGERKTRLEIQKDLLQFGDSDHRRQRPGVLFTRKQDPSNKVSLKSLRLTDEEAVQLPDVVLGVTVKNAEYFHFDYARSDDKENAGEVTSDGAMVIPNLKNFVGLSEIECAFRTMAGVEPGLIPRGWIANHYRLIVWKLASYERFLPQYLRGCLCVENIVRQLKYRYDREIDRAERSALRKILEKDDVPQKRMVLCVSDISRVGGNKIELELTDGWYLVKTSIDEALTNQVLRKRIKIGTKLMIQGADVLNCDGCHPLEATDLVKLKIGYNCTRRAAWHVKLGYQRWPEPFAILLKTIHPNGGAVACLKMYVARVYPVRYLEQTDGVKMWRNWKAEEKREREFENECLCRMERLHCDVEKEYNEETYLENRNKSFDNAKLNSAEVSKITCAKTLYNVLEASNDPDNLMEMLTADQRTRVLEYRQSLSLQRQRDIARTISQQVEKLKLTKRKVLPILKILVLDGGEQSERAHQFFIWSPTEEHVQLLKEDTTFYAYNVNPRANGDLFSSSRTHFRLEKTSTSCHGRSKRQMFPIAMVLDPYYKPTFNEFDTVGLVVQIVINENNQELWIADVMGRLLYVKIKDGPKVCCLLDGISRGQIVALTNLIYCQPNKDFGQAIGNQFTVISHYPHQQFLQEGIEMFKIQAAKDITKLLNDCDKHIEKCCVNVDSRQNNNERSSLLYNSPLRTTVINSMNDSSEDDTVIPTRLTSIDVAMSLIDTQQFY